MLAPACKLFRDIARERNLTRAAQLNGITVSAASQQLRELERQMSVPLLDRSTRPVSLTEAGRLYDEFCQDVLRRQAELDRQLAAVRGVVSGSVRVAAIYSVGLVEMNCLEKEFREREPHVSLQVEYLRPERVIEAVVQERADLGLVSYPEPTKELAVLPWRRERMVVAVAPNHRFARRRTIRPADLDGEPFVTFDEELPIRHAIDRYLQDAGVRPQIGFHFDNLQMIGEAVALGQAVSIVPERTLEAQREAGRLLYIPLTDPALYRPIGIIHRRRQVLRPAVESFVQLLRATASDERPAAAAQAV